MMNRFTLPSIALAAALLAAPVAAQQSLQDFTLPPNPTPTPTVEGPADQVGPIAIPPRAITTAAPTPEPTPASSPAPAATTAPPAIDPLATASPVPAQTGTAVVQPLPSPSPTHARIVTPTASPLQNPPPQPQTAAEPGPSETPSALDSLSRLSPQPVVPVGPSEEPLDATGNLPWPKLPDWWPWAAGLLAVLLAGVGGGWWLARRRASRPAPTIEPPIIAHDSGNAEASGMPRLHVTFEATQMMRSMMMLTLRYRLTLANRGDQPLRDLAISADLVSARRELPVEQQLATETTQLPACHSIERIGPHQSTSITGQLQLPVEAIEVFQQGNLPLCVPLARIRIESPSASPILQTFLIGIGAAGGSGRVQPLPLSGPPGGYEGIRARAID